jgi:hypothetical protein
MVQLRFQGISQASGEKIREAIEAHGEATLQFNVAPESGALDQADAWCEEFGAALKIRFYAFNWREFDTSLVRRLPHVANLSIDTIRTISDFGPVADLKRLTRFGFGVFEHPDGRFLQQLDVSRLTHLTVLENKKRNFDLTPLAKATALEQAFIQGHDRGVEAISRLPRLTDVSLSGFPKRHDLAFLNSLTAMRSLFLILGSRASITEFTHTGLSKLRIVWVRLLEELGPLSRFTALEDLTIEDQLRLSELDVSGLRLRRLKVQNCKRLERVLGLEGQAHLKHLELPSRVTAAR